MEELQLYSDSRENGNPEGGKGEGKESEQKYDRKTILHIHSFKQKKWNTIYLLNIKYPSPFLPTGFPLSWE